MYNRSVSDADLVRLKGEREQADRLYNDALGGVDAALTKPPSLPPLPPPPDHSQLSSLQELQTIVPAQPVPFDGWKARVAGFVWRLIGPMLQQQQAFNAAVVQHAVRNATRGDESAAAVAAMADRITDEFGALVRLQSRLIHYLQQVTLYVDTKDRYEIAVQRHELERRTEGLAAGLNAFGDELLKRREQSQFRDQRLDTRFAELRARIEQELRLARPASEKSYTVASSPSVPQSGTGVPPGTSLSSPQSGTGVPPVVSPSSREQLASDADSRTYAGFEDLYRGSVEDIKDRLADYLPLLSEAGDVVDLGCGRGEFLQALKEHGITARGVDLNMEMVARCHALGLDVTQADGLDFLAALPDESVGAVFAAQVVEHLPPDRLLHLLDLVRAKLRPGGRVVLETVNPACWAAFFSSYIRDITHVRPIHPDTLRFLLVARGFGNVDIRYRSPYPVEAKLHPLSLAVGGVDPSLREIAEEFNRNVDVLNGQLFTYMDYAAVGEKP
ncbi:MAG TPA: methyltransferase domain-containing protein [Vicinamibacterales bacterium]